jgi:hypothetical protein
LKPIEKIVVGDNVLSYNEQTREMEFRRVTELVRGTSINLVDLTFGGDRVTCSPPHRFLNSEGHWTQAGELHVTDLIQTAHGRSLAVTSSRSYTVPNGLAVFNFEVEGCHNYCVSEAAIIVHNHK